MEVQPVAFVQAIKKVLYSLSMGTSSISCSKLTKSIYHLRVIIWGIAVYYSDQLFTNFGNLVSEKAEKFTFEF